MSTIDELLARKNATVQALDNTISSLDDKQKEVERLHSIAINTTNLTLTSLVSQKLSIDTNLEYIKSTHNFLYILLLYYNLYLSILVFKIHLMEPKKEL